MTTADTAVTTTAGTDTAETLVERDLAGLRSRRPTAPLLELHGVTKTFHVRDGMHMATISAVDTVDLDVYPGTTLGIVGESGCGKSTLARLIVGLHRPNSGSIVFEERELSSRRARPKAVLQSMQMVFQDPSSALNPRATVSESIAFPLRVQGVSRRETEIRVAQVLADVGLPKNYLTHYPHQLSGGQRQRVNIARALALHPRLIVLDEAVSALDKSIQAQILNLLKDLQAEYKLTYVFISHDLNVVEYMSDEVAVMYLGQLVERAPSAALYKPPAHPYTDLLLSSIPSLDPALSRRDVVLDRQAGEIPSPLNPPSGCRFRTRCPHAMEVCAEVVPPLAAVDGEHHIACHLFPESSDTVEAA
jgi:peptide/nickel transport system ATP-binding protein